MQTACRPQYSKKPISKFQKLENMQIFLKQLAARSITLVNIGGEDLVEGNKKLILGLTWTLIQRYEIHKFGAGEKDVLEWARATCKRASGRAMATGGWSEAFADGQAFCYLVHDAEPAALNLDATRAMAPPAALEAAFAAAESALDVPRLLEASDFEAGHPVDDKTIIL